MMKAGKDWRKAYNQYWQERFTSLSLKLMMSESLELSNEVRQANVPWMIHISGTNEHIELSMWLRALTAQAQRRNYQGRALPLSK
ncbi:hypothetical protein Scep_003814 [Stephania cephalantha]|uniref:Uncharacterized protein n=1 Tax=Stephania cephalantha TaxID=152367 RepID=A0AAP0PW39_9MAGN